MLTIPWFLTSTMRDLLRYPRPHQMQQQRQQQQLQQQQHSPSLTRHVASRTSSNNTTPLQPKQQPGPLRQEHAQVTFAQQQQQTTAAAARPGPNKVPASPQQTRKAPPSPSASRSKMAQGTAQSPSNSPSPSPRLKRAQREPASSPPSAQEIKASSVLTSSATLVLTPSVSANRMGEQWAQKMVDKFAFDFDKADKDKSGTLSSQEVIAVLKTVGFKGSDVEAKFIFAHLDKNKDDKITRDEFKASMTKLPQISIKEFALRKAFLQMDKDGSGFLSKEEVMDATKAQGEIAISAKVISDILVYLCEEDKDQKVSYDEFLAVLGLEESASVMNQIFRKLDTDGSGFLSRDEIMNAVSNEHELKLKAEKISDLLCYWCKDADKKISYQEFVQVWLKQKEAVKGKK